MGGEVNPNHQDAEAVVAISQWMMAELIRIFHDVDIDAAAEAVDYIVERRIPLIWEVNGKVRVLNPSLSTNDKTLAILYSKKETLSVDTLFESLEYRNNSRYRNELLDELHSSRFIEYDRGGDSATISPLGVRYVEDELDLSVAL